VSLFGKRPSRNPPAAVPPRPVDPQLPDDAWWQASCRAFSEQVDAHYGSPETMRDGGKERYGVQDFGTAMLLFAKAIDMLHTAYGFNHMDSRQPSPADVSIIDGFVASLGASLSTHPDAAIEECAREVTHCLRSIATECDRVGAPSSLYRGALEQMEHLAPRVPVDDVRWN